MDADDLAERIEQLRDSDPGRFDNLLTTVSSLPRVVGDVQRDPTRSNIRQVAATFRRIADLLGIKQQEAGA